MTESTSAREDVDIVRRLAADDAEGLAELLRRCGAQVLALLRQRFRGVLREEDLEDVLSIGLYRLWKHWRRYDNARASLRVWYFRICENAARDVLRLGWQRARSREVIDIDLIAGCNSTARGTGPPDELPDEQAAMQTQLQVDLKEVLNDLPDVQRTILLADAAARDDVACSQRLGDELGIPAATVRVYRKRALDKLRRALTDRGHALATLAVVAVE